MLHFHDNSVPPEEEVLAAKLILEHREPWLRNEATCLLQTKDGKWHDFGFMYYRTRLAMPATVAAMLRSRQPSGLPPRWP